METLRIYWRHIIIRIALKYIVWKGDHKKAPVKRRRTRG